MNRKESQDEEDEEQQLEEEQQQQLSKQNQILLLRLLRELQKDPSLWFVHLSNLYPRTWEDVENLPKIPTITHPAHAHAHTDNTHADNAHVDAPPTPPLSSQIDTEMKNFLSSLPKPEECNGIDLYSQQDGLIAQRLPLIVRYNVLSFETCPELFVHPGGLFPLPTHNGGASNNTSNTTPPTTFVFGQQTEQKEDEDDHDNNDNRTYNGGYSHLTGTGLYGPPSYFNHSSQPLPNVSRWAIGDILFFVTNRFIQKGEEMCISYIETDALCEHSFRRCALLDMDFVDEDVDLDVDVDEKEDKEREEEEEEEDEIPKGPVLPVVDVDVQEDLMSMPPLDRLDAIAQLKKRALGEWTQEDNDDDDDDSYEKDNEEEDGPWFRCDVQQLQTLESLTLDKLGRFQEALASWQKCIQFVDDFLPPLDENGIALRVQAAISATACNDLETAKQLAKRALDDHHLLFGGGGVKRFRLRYEREMELSRTLRPSHLPLVLYGRDALDALWPLEEEDDTTTYTN